MSLPCLNPPVASHYIQTPYPVLRGPYKVSPRLPSSSIPCHFPSSPCFSPVPSVPSFLFLKLIVPSSSSVPLHLLSQVLVLQFLVQEYSNHSSPTPSLSIPFCCLNYSQKLSLAEIILFMFLLTFFVVCLSLPECELQENGVLACLVYHVICVIGTQIIFIE